ncbi:MAG TPA: tRNA uridine-5-carboxymethylaminomethyl(34) synthesis GTPase MnmE, partial [Gemmatimonadales bacterium]|nr:tRNA uridine-5-carboxymethylaminomethyl(34) synthesis GTPase MnmE [Gemmatimonadales bacterium]
MLSDPIAALATPPGRSALALIRLSGDDALEVAGRIIQSAATLPFQLRERRPTLLTLASADGVPIDQAMVTVFRAPRSYTGEDLVEFSCHGGLLVPAQVLAALHAAGARAAVPGEFTRRALLNGKLDLLQVEAIGDLIDATAPEQGRAALHQLEGGLSSRLLALREDLLELLSLLAYDIDFPEEDDGPVRPERIRARLDVAATSIAALLATAPAGERLREGALVVLAGRPNAGKSSLFNALLGISRALVTEIPGTTRDTIEASSDVLGWPVRLADTAGLRDTDERLEQLGIEVSRRYVGAADLLLLCVESGRLPTREERDILAARPALLVRSKADLVPIAERESEEGIPISALTGEGVDRLRWVMAERLFGGGAVYADLEPMLTRERHRVALARAGSALAAAR